MLLAGAGLSLIACIPVNGDGTLVPIASEQAIIVWDPQTKTEHFIREATFEGNSKDFGFIVPTPTEPKLTEADSYSFAMLNRAITPKVTYRYNEGFKLGWFGSPGEAAKAADTGASGGVSVLGTADVSGMKAVSLRADDAAALAKWLNENGYKSTPVLEEWMKDYVKRKWVLTAFKVIDGRYLAPVCISFKTDVPVYPYKEPPTEKTSGGRLLRVFFLSDARYDGKLAGKPWSATVPFSDRSPQLADIPMPEPIPAGSLANQRLTVFEDRANPRNGTADIEFAMGVQDTVVPPPVVVNVDRRRPISPGIWIPTFVVVAIGGITFVTRRRRSA